MEESNHPVALIVGGSSGIGLATAKRLLERHISVTIFGKSPDKLETAVRELSTLGTVKVFPADLYAPDGVRRILAFAENHSRHIKYLVNAAGYFKPTPFCDHTSQDYDRYLNLNLNLNRALFFISQAVAKNMAANGGGSIVHTGSMWARQAVKATPSSAYSMAKAGLHALTQHMAMELADHKIRVNAVSPAVVHPPIYQTFIEPSQVVETLSLLQRVSPNRPDWDSRRRGASHPILTERRGCVGDRCDLGCRWWGDGEAQLISAGKEEPARTQNRHWTPQLRTVCSTTNHAPLSSLWVQSCTACVST